MAFQLPPIPNFNVQPPDVLGGQEKAATLAQMLNASALQKQLAPLQVQEQQEKSKQASIQTQTMQAEADSQKAMMKAWSDPEFTKKITGGDKADAGGLGFDPDAMTSELTSRGVLPKEALALTQEFVKRSQAIAATQKDVAQTGEANASIRQKTLKQVGDALGAIQSKPVDKAQEALEAFQQRLVRDPKAFPGLTQDEMAHLYSMDLTHLGAAGGMMELEAQMNEFHKGQAEKLKAEQGVIPSDGGLSPEGKQKIKQDIEVATNPQIQKGKVDVAKAEGAARAQVQLAMEPIRLQIQQQFTNQKDARDKIESTVLKPFQDKMTDVNMARTALAQAANNPVAARAAVFKMVGVAQPAGSHRVLPMEFEAFKYPGGVGTQVVEKWNDFLKGSPWTPEVAAAANAFIDGQAAAAQQNLNSGIDNTNKLYGTQVGAGLKGGGEKQAHPFFSKFGGTVRQ